MLKYYAICPPKVIPLHMRLIYQSSLVRREMGFLISKHFDELHAFIYFGIFIIKINVFETYFREYYHCVKSGPKF